MPKKISIYIVDTIGRGGTEVWARSLIKTLSNNYDVRLVSGSLHPEIRNYVSSFAKISAPAKPAFLRLLVFAILSTFVSKSKTEIIHVVGAISFKKSHLNSIHFYHRENFRLRKTTIYRNPAKLRILNRLIYTIFSIFLEKIVYKKYFSPEIASMSPEMCELIEKDLHRNVHLTHNGVDPSELGNIFLNFDSHYLLFVGGDWERKGLIDVLECLSLVRIKYPEIKLFVAGSGRRITYEAHSEKLGLKSNVEWLGEIPRSKIPFSHKSILICASSFEVSPLIFLEAAMMGTPVISYPVFGTKEASQEGYLLVCEASANGMAEKVLEVLDNPQLYSDMSLNGLLLKNSRAWHLAVEETIKLYPK